MDIIKQFLCIIHARLGPVAGGWLAGCNGDNPSWLINSIPRNLAREIWAEPSWAVLCWVRTAFQHLLCTLHTSTQRLEAGDSATLHSSWKWNIERAKLRRVHLCQYVPSPGGCGVNHHLDAVPSPPLPWQGFLGWSRCAHCAESPLSAANKNVAAGDLNQDPGLATLHPTTQW